MSEALLPHACCCCNSLFSRASLLCCWQGVSSQTSVPDLVPSLILRLRQLHTWLHELCICTCTCSSLRHVSKIMCYSMQVDQAHIVRAPMPGVVKKIYCEEGDSVAEGAILVTLEAMKMQNPLFSPMTGIV